MIDWKKLENFAVYSAIIVGTLMLRFVGDYPDGLVEFLKSNVYLAVKIADYFGLVNVVNILINIPSKVLLLLLGILHMVAGFCALKMKKSQMEQGVMLLLDELPQVVKSGIVLYGMLLALLVISIYSVVGIPFAAFLLSVTEIIIILGRIPLAIFFGYLLMERLSVAGYTYLYFFIGGFFMLLCETVYGVGGAFLFFVFPVLAMGALFTLLLYRCGYRVSLPVRFPTSASSEKFDRNKIRDIITGKK